MTTSSKRVISTGVRATQVIETVDDVEPELVALVRRSVRWLDPSFPETGERGDNEGGQWTNDDGTVTQMQQVEEFDRSGRGIRTIRLLFDATGNDPQQCAVRVIAVGLPNDAVLEVRWNITVSTTEVRGNSAELTVRGANDEKCIREFGDWFEGSDKTGTGMQDVIPLDKRIGRLLGDGRFEVTEWIGPDSLMGIAIARDLEGGGLVRLTFAIDVARTAEELEPILTRDVPGLAPVVYLGATAADDGWGSGSMMMAEELPPGKALDLEIPVDAYTIAAFGVGLVAHIARIHRTGVGLGTLRPESTFITDEGEMTLIGRGERLWMMPIPNKMKSTMLSPWRGGYRAPELLLGPVPDHPDPAADVFSIGVILATWLLGRFAYPGDSDFQVFQAQMKGDHHELPKTPLGDLLSRCLQFAPADRPPLGALERALRAIASEGN
jgi:hypothetical protein